MSSAGAGAAGAHVGARCPRLAPAEYDELDARVMLLLTAASSSRPLPSVVCDERDVWVEWDGRRFPVTGQAPLADEVVDIVESALAGVHAAPRPTPPRDVSPLVPAPVTPASPAARIARRAPRMARAKGGGVALALETELPAVVGPALGPSFDFGVSVGPFVLGPREAFRLASAGHRVAFMDFEGALSYGAPLQRGRPFGVVVRFGAECMLAYGRASAPAHCGPTTAAGVRVARSFGSMSVWLGLDARWRLSSLRAGLDPVTANAIAGSFSLGIAFLDPTRK